MEKLRRHRVFAYKNAFRQGETRLNFFTIADCLPNPRGLVFGNLRLVTVLDDISVQCFLTVWERNNLTEY